jgi:lincosamide nucleotidyltransferase A/C/D/E
MVVGNAARQQIDLHPVVLDEYGNGWQPLDGEAWDQYPREGLAGEGEIGGRAVRCLTAALQLRHHLGYPWDEDDQGDMGRLAAAFGVPMPPPQRDVPHNAENPA